MRTVLVGNRALAKHALRHMVDSGWNVVGVVAPPVDSGMALGQAGFEPFDDIADRHDIALLETDDINDEETASDLATLDPDLCVCPGWSQIIDEEVLAIPSEGFVGFHASKLPRGRGGAPVNWRLIHGANDLWLSLFYYAPGVDAGDVIRQRAIQIEDRDDVATVLDRLAVAARDVLDDVREEFEAGTVEATPQDLRNATYRPRRQPQDGLVDWHSSAERIDDWVRAQTHPYPGAYTFFDGAKVTIWRAESAAGEPSGTPGEVVAVSEGEGIDVATGDGVVRLARVQRNDGPPTWADDFADRHDVSPGTRLSTSQAPPDWLYTGIRDGTGGTHFETNLERGETGTVKAVATSPGRDRELRVVGEFDGETVTDETVFVESEESVSVEYEPEETGTHSLRIEFYENEVTVDTRYLKVFVPE